MKCKFILSLFLASATFGVFAQTHKEGVEYYRADQFNNALELLERNYNNPGTDKAVANYYLGLLSIKQNDLAKAKKHFEDGIAVNPDYPYNYVGLGSLELRNNQLKEAEKLFKKAEKINKKDAAIEVAIARAYYNSSKDGAVKYAKQIEKALKNARKRNMLEPEIFIFEGDVAYDANDIDQAAAMYDMATNYNDKAADAYVKYANLFTKLNPQYSVNMLKKLLEKNPTSALGQRELANAYYEQNDYTNAAKYYGSYVNNPNHFKSDEDRYALLLFYNSDYKQGYDFATRLLADNPGNYTAQRYQMMNAAQLSEMADIRLALAEKLYEKHKLDPEKYAFAPIDYNLISSEFITAKKFDEATALLQEAIKQYPDNTNFYKEMAMIPLERQDYAGAAEAWKVYLSKVADPNFTDYMQEAVLCYYAALINKEDKTVATKYYNEAISYANKAISKNDRQYRPYKVIGDSKIMLAAPEQQATVAKDDYTKAIQLIDKEKYAADYETMAKYLGIIQ